MTLAHVNVFEGNKTIWFRLGYSLPDDKAKRLEGMVEMVYGERVNVNITNSIYRSNLNNTNDICIQPVDGNFEGFRNSATYAEVRGFVHGCLLVLSFQN